MATSVSNEEVFRPLQQAHMRDVTRCLFRILDIVVGFQRRQNDDLRRRQEKLNWKVSFKVLKLNESHFWNNNSAYVFVESDLTT